MPEKQILIRIEALLWVDGLFRRQLSRAKRGRAKEGDYGKHEKQSK
jgi:hypothetical protein